MFGTTQAAKSFFLSKSIVSSFLCRTQDPGNRSAARSAAYIWSQDDGSGHGCGCNSNGSGSCVQVEKKEMDGKKRQETCFLHNDLSLLSHCTQWHDLIMIFRSPTRTRRIFLMLDPFSLLMKNGVPVLDSGTSNATPECDAIGRRNRSHDSRFRTDTKCKRMCGPNVHGDANTCACMSCASMKRGKTCDKRKRETDRRLALCPPPAESSRTELRSTLRTCTCLCRLPCLSDRVMDAGR